MSKFEDKQLKTVQTKAAVHSNYKGYDAFVGMDDKIYLGKSSNYMFKKEHGYLPFYDNSDNSLVFISDNHTMFSFLYGSGWVLSQDEMINEGCFTKDDYIEFAKLQDGVLAQFEKIHDIMFDGKPFQSPDVTERKPSIRQQLTENIKKSAPSKSTDAKKKEDIEI